MSSIRVAQLSDVSDTVSLVNSAYRGESSQMGWTTEAELLGGQRTDEEQIKEIIQKPDSILLVYINEMNKLQACVQLEKVEQGVAYLGMLTVQPLLQNSGLGKILLKEAEAFVKKEWQASSIEMTVISLRTELIDWYLRRGYALSGENRAFPLGDPRFGIPKRNDLEFVVLRKNI